MSQTYRKNSGKYQLRCDFYDNCDIDNPYMRIYKSLRCVYNDFYNHGLDNFSTPHPEEKTLAQIRDLLGLARMWGHIKSILELFETWRENQDETTLVSICKELAESLESSLNTFFEILPAFVSWTPKTKLPENQGVVNMLQERANCYRSVSNPKFYAYDRAVETLSNTDIVVTAQNCKYFYGIGPQLFQHIKDYFSGQEKKPTSSIVGPIRKKQTLLIDQLWGKGHTKLAQEVALTNRVPETRRELSRLRNYSENVIDNQVPRCRNILNIPIVEWLWKNATDKNRSAFHRAAKAVARKNNHVPVDEIATVKGVGPKIAKELKELALLSQAELDARA